MRNIAKRLMAYEAPSHKSAQDKTSPGFSVCDKLRPSLATLMGIGGYRALLSRALALSCAEVPWLGRLEVNADGSLQTPEELRAQLEPGEFSEGRVVLLAHLLGLLVAFIGPNLTSNLVGEVWPELSLGRLDFSKGDKNEKTK